MSGNNLSVDGELRYIIQWFNEWSELQREDFLPFVVDYLTKERGSHYMNGVVNSLAAASFDDKPMSLFQCRVSYQSMYTHSHHSDLIWFAAHIHLVINLFTVTQSSGIPEFIFSVFSVFAHSR